jgi:predicted RNA-binding protein with RPS1 domain
VHRFARETTFNTLNKNSTVTYHHEVLYGSLLRFPPYCGKRFRFLVGSQIQYVSVDSRIRILRVRFPSEYLVRMVLFSVEHAAHALLIFSSTTGFVSSRVSTGAAPTLAVVAPHASSCACAVCGRTSTVLFSDASTEAEAAEVPAPAEAVAEVPAEVVAMDGIESTEEAHNADRPARKAIKSKGPRGKALSEFKVGDSVTGKVKSLASYGAFIDIGASTDGLLHISQLSKEFVSDVTEILKEGQELEVRITNIDEKRNQVGLTLLSEEDEEAAKAAQPRQRESGPRGGGRKDTSKILNQLTEKGWDRAAFVEGIVVSTVDFGCFVKIDASKLNAEVEGEMDGLVHISALTLSRVDSVDSVVKVDQKVQVRVKDIAKGKVSLSMVSVEDEATKAESRGGGGRDFVPMGNKNWAEDLATLQETQPKFTNGPMVTDMRK